MKRVHIIGVPMDLGANRRGVDMGPSAIRIGGLHQNLKELRLQTEDRGNLDVKTAEVLALGIRRQRYMEEISQVCRRLAEVVEQALEQGSFPVVLGGDHSIAVGTVSGLASFLRRRERKVGLLWMDAHTDMNTPETSPTGNVHGMPLAALLGLGAGSLDEIGGFAPKVHVANVVVIGARSIDGEERRNIQKAGLRVITMKEVDMRGMRAVMEEALQRVTDGTEGFHCSFDLDVVDPQVAPGVGTPVRGGITYRESHLAMEMVADSRRCLALEVVEVNPVLDVGNATGSLAAELIASALGKKIL